MTSEINWLEGGTITSPKGFTAGATYSGIRTYTEDKLDLGIVCSESVCTVAGTFTKNAVKSPSVVLDQQRVATGRAQAVVINSGIANACVGEQGMTDAIEMAALAAAKLGLEAELVLACSTGLIGVELPMGLIRSGTDKIEMHEDGGHELARAICTTDLVSKEAAVSFEVDGVTYTLGGIAKGSGMIHPNMATMLAFLATDAPVDGAYLQTSLSRSVDCSFNMISVDGDSSTNDTVLLLANGAAGGSAIDASSPGADAFQAALDAVCADLAKAIARDGEGASKLIEVVVENAMNESDARVAALSVASSMLVKSAIHGADPNWGRIIVALGYSGAQVKEELVALYINDVCIMEGGRPIPYFKDAVVLSMSGTDVSLRLNLGLGDASATAWGCDLSEEYVTFNSAYTT
ncbi:MAG: bifunctional glutamate N-acetyltransferase/amino-acid acetyltransferase ArgJ [Chloroflexota bacterium]|nr:bifunctional glutamate N-acetyltransferase/amino-acid acetyltransferase ArgJ [Chloroflexota bacterium]MDE2941744.1 bifunctional glutamate N-acetyltransferase/amino-acid acetyltransferase ArgJ [Chloroflexota bacterium]MDE3268469.1 bifunctional glutamate N-acetyltransferase/amino-acid acetyltransferase ArgJ [Chloroflexota bacterium]